MVSIEHDPTGKRSEINYVGGTALPVWSFIGDTKIPLFTHKLQGKHKRDIIAGLAIFGKTTAYTLAREILQKEESRKKNKVIKNIRNTPKRKDIYYKIIEDRKEKSKTFPGLISNGFVTFAGKNFTNRKEDTKEYFLTLKGSLLASGFIFNNEELCTFIKNASKTSLYFSYLDTIVQKTTIEFVKGLFIIPYQNLIRKNLIHFDDNLQFYFSNIAESIGHQVYGKIESMEKNTWVNERENWQILEDEFHNVVYDNIKDEMENEQDKQNVEILINNTFYDMQKFLKWNNKMINYFYPRNREEDFYRMNSEYYDSTLLYKVMRAIHVAYYDALGFGIPQKHRQKIPHSRNS